MLTLDDINKLPSDPTPDHLVALGLVPPPAAPVPIIPPPSGKIPTPSPVTPAPAVDNSWKAKLMGTTPHATAPLAPLPPAPDMGGPTAPTATPETPFGANFPKLAPLNFKERQALPTTSEGVAPGSSAESLAQLERLQDQKANPWGSPENHPGILGKIAHVAAKAGNIAGDIFAPATMANIPGTDLNKQVQERHLENQLAGREKAELEAKDAASLRELRGAETERAKAETAKLGGGGTPDFVIDSAGNAVGWRGPDGAVHTFDEEGTPPALKAIAEKWQGKTSAKEASPEGQTFDDLMSGGKNGGPQINPDTDAPYTSLEAYEALKKAGGKEREQTPANTPATPEAIADYQARLKGIGLDPKSAATFSEVPPGTTMGELEKRYTDAKALREMGQKDRENAIRDQERRDNAAERAKEHEETREDKQEKEGRTLVRVRDEKTGKTYVEALAKAKSDGVSPDAMEEVPAAEKTPIQDARLVVKVLNKKGDKPEQQGVFQLIDGLEKDGKLGVLQSRLNSFLAGGVGTLPGDDPRVMALLDKADLAMTLSMKAHFGVSGGRSPQMLEHFLNLANAKKMDGPALRAGFKAVNNYMEDRAEMPPSSGGGGGGGPKVPQKGDKVDGYTFMGGDPSDKKNWKK